MWENTCLGHWFKSKFNLNWRIFIMCGICGIFDTKNRVVDEKIITRMRDIMFSRGTDDAGIYVSNHSLKVIFA